MRKSALLIELESLIKNQLLILDGAMGTMVQLYKMTESDYRGVQFKSHFKNLKGNNDVLVLTKPSIIYDIHMQYLQAGADIVETNTFNGTSVAQEDYGLESFVFEINKRAAELARRACHDHFIKTGKRSYVAGAIGPTNKTASMSPDVSNPGYRAISFDELVKAYKEQVLGLLAGGAEILLPETTFDTLNLKAALFAISEVEAERNEKLPVMISVTITDLSGRTLSGQTVEAFWHSIQHAKPLSVGINCALGAQEMHRFVRDLARVADCAISCYPNAGLPNPLSVTGYDETPESLAYQLGLMVDEGLINIVGGCCGTTPAHIERLAISIKGKSPHRPGGTREGLHLSGLEPFSLHNSKDRAFALIGERTNVTGSPKFAKAIKDFNYDEAIQIARSQIERGANILDVNFDEGMIDGPEMMTRFLNLLAAEPDVAARPVMIDSSKWEVLHAGLKCLQGKCVVNSISLKEGEGEFVRQARLIRRFGAAVVVMAFDENGQAATREDKVRICKRAYKILTEEVGFFSGDIIFDANVLSVATGISEHNKYAIDFIDAIPEIKKCCPGSFVSGGISNLSFSFRGNRKVREAMHAVFLFHAISAGLDMGIVNAGMLEVYDEIEPHLRQLVEDVILNKSDDAAERLLQFADTLKVEKNIVLKKEADWRKFSLQERMDHAFLHGIETHIVQDVEEARVSSQSPLSVIEGPLMESMKRVGDLFGAGKMFLPQVVKSARVMKRAVAHLEPYIDRDKKMSSNRGQGTVVLATVKGDVHDIGKNIVSIVLTCNGYQVIDLGVMVSFSDILAAIKKYQADVVGFSGLITPSLDEMMNNLVELQRNGIAIPVLIGGATTSKLHTAVKLDPCYSGAVCHVNDASRVAEVVGALLNENKKAHYVAEVKEFNRRIREDYLKNLIEREMISLDDARKIKLQIDWREFNPPRPSKTGVFEISFSHTDIENFIDWSPLFWTWGLKGTYPQILESPKYGEEAKNLFADATALLKKIFKDSRFNPHVLVGVFQASSVDEHVKVFDKNGHEIESLYFERQVRREVIQNQTSLSLADFIVPDVLGKKDYVGCFIVTAGEGVEAIAREYEDLGDDYNNILVKALADRIAEALAEYAHLRMRQIFGIYEQISKEDILAEKYIGIRPAPGYPACPSHAEKVKIWRLLDADKLSPVKLTENYAMKPASSVSGYYFMNPKAKYFAI